MTVRRIEINLDTILGNKLYWLLKELMAKYPEAIKEVSE